MPSVPPPPTFEPPAKSPRAKYAVESCAVPGDSHYCVWGTRPVELTISNSRTADFVTSARQVFTALSQMMTSVETEVGVEGAGGLEPLMSGNSSSSACVAVVLATETGLEVARTDLVSRSTESSLERVAVPLTSGLLPGVRYALELRPMPACEGRVFHTMVAMLSDWKYPQSAGSLTIDGRSSIGSLWARID